MNIAYSEKYRITSDKYGLVSLTIQDMAIIFKIIKCKLELALQSDVKNKHFHGQKKEFQSPQNNSLPFHYKSGVRPYEHKFHYPGHRAGPIHHIQCPDLPCDLDMPCDLIKQ